MSAAALAGLFVLDLSDSVGGQFCGRLFADHGAEVVLAEPPDGTPLRREPLLFHHLNTSKRSWRLDGPVRADDPALARLLGRADVVLLPAVGAGALRVPERAVTVSIRPFAEGSPLADWAASEMIVQALSGMMTNNGSDGRPPLYGCGRRSAFAGGLAGYVGALAALLQRRDSGSGQHVAIDEAETAAAMCFPYVMQYIYNGTVHTRAGFTIPAGQVKCRDGWVCIWIYNHRWPQVCATLGLPELQHDPRFAEPQPRRANWSALFAALQERVQDWSAEDLVDRLQKADVIAAKAITLPELAEQTHLAARGYWGRTPSGRLVLGPPYRFSATPRRPPADAPLLGEANGFLSEPPATTPDPVAPAPAVLPRRFEAGPLQGLRVVELTTAWAGPMAGRVLGFLGAEVIHVESPNRVNSWRLNKEVPNPINFPDRSPGARPFDRSFLFNSQNVNKRSCILNLKTAEARALFANLLKGADVLLCNFRPGTLGKLGLGRERLQALNPRLVVAELPAFGLEGPMAGYAALGPTMEMAAGMSSLIGYAGGKPETTGPSYLDPIGGFNTAAAVLTALVHRQQSGEGQHVEVPQVEAAMHFIGAEILAAIESGRQPERDGNRRPDASPHDAYPARPAADEAESFVAIAVESEAQWRALCIAMGQPGLADDPRFATLAARKANEDALDAVIAAFTGGHDRHALAAALQTAGVPAAPVQTPRDVAGSRHLRQIGFFGPLEHPDAGRHDYPGLPFRLSRTPGSQRRAAPCFGADTAAILKDLLGLDEPAIRQAAEAGAIAPAPLPGA